MTDEQIKQNAEAYINHMPSLCDALYESVAKEAFIAGAHSRDVEIKALEGRIVIQDCRISTIMRLEAEIAQLRNPWISVEDRLPEEPLTICAVWLRGDDLVPHISLYDSGRFLLLPVDVTVTHWMPIQQINKGK